MKQINDILKKYQLTPYRYEKLGKTTIVDTKRGRFVLKENNSKYNILEYLNTRNFNYYPKYINNKNDRYEITEYVEEVDIPKEQKALDLIKLVALLHSKTTHYKEHDFDDYKKIYEDIKNNIEYLNGYYHDMIILIESHVFMSPSEYLLACNISTIFGSLNYCTKEIEAWYEMVKNKTKQREVVLHNNLSLDHFIDGDKNYLINWKKSKIGLPIYDLYILYKRHAIDFDFEDLLVSYEQIYPLHDDELKLFFILISLPNKIEFKDTEYNMTKLISSELDSLYKTEKLLPYYSKNNV